MKTLAALALLLAAVPSRAASRARPNIVFLDICSARADHFGVYGYKRDTTPRLDRLARRAAVFENAMSQSSWCLPNYASLFTGQRPENHGLYTNVPTGIPRFETTLAEKLKEGGYETAAFSGGVYEIPAWGLSRGFDTYVNIFSTSTPDRVPAPVEDNMKAVGSWLKGRGKQKPFFLYLAIDNLHVPYRASHPDEYAKKLPGPPLPKEDFGVPFDRAYNGETSGYPPETKAAVAAFKKDPNALKRYVARYDAAVNDVDGQIGVLIARLKKAGLYGNTILIITGDHGEMLGEHGLLGHTEGLYQPVLHVPLIVRDPRAPGSYGRRYGQLIERVDMMPTILSMASVGYAGLPLSGKSFLPVLEDPHAPWRR
ncbi:MAG: sulfatase [Elusimicrobia bacterium]|nr:sulfatase [Elusimicrobiota bacterium]